MKGLNGIKPIKLNIFYNQSFGCGNTNAIKINVTPQKAKGTSNVQEHISSVERISSALLLTFNSYFRQATLQIKFPRSTSPLHHFTETFSESCQTSTIGCFSKAKIVNG